MDLSTVDVSKHESCASSLEGKSVSAGLSVGGFTGFWIVLFLTSRRSPSSCGFVPLFPIKVFCLFPSDFPDLEHQADD